MKARRYLLAFSLIELMIVIAILAVVLSLGLPSLMEVVRNARVRARAESIQVSLQSARMEAMKRNAVVWFQLVDNVSGNCNLSASGPFWVTSIGSVAHACATVPDPSGNVVLAKSDPLTLDATGGTIDGVVVDSGNPLFCFNSLGQLTSCIDPDGLVGAIAATDIDVSLPSAEDCRATSAAPGVACMRVQVRSGGQVKLCDPVLIDPTGTDSRRCIP